MRSLVLLAAAASATTLAAQSELVPSYFIAGDTVLRIEHRWTRMGDDDGTFDTPSDNVSVENGQFSHDETVIATVAKGDNSIRLWDADDGTELWRQDGVQETECLAFTADDAYLVTGGEATDREINVLDAATGEKLRTFAVGTSTEGMVFSPDYALLATGNEGGEVWIYDTSDPDVYAWPDTPRYVLVHGPDKDLSGVDADEHSDINQMEWSADGATLFSGSRDGTLKAWSRADFGTEGELIRTYEAGLRGSVKGIDLSEDGTLIVSGSNSNSGTGPRPARIVAFDIATAEVVFDYAIPSGRTPENVTFDPSGRLLLAASSPRDNPESNARTFIWTVDSVEVGATKPRQIIGWFEQEYLDFSDAADRLIVSGNDGSVRVFDVAIDLDAGRMPPADTTATDTTTADTTSTAFALPSGRPLEVFPNPATDQLTLQLPPDVTAGRLQVFGPTGQLLAEQRVTAVGGRLQLDASRWPRGTVALRMIAAGREYRTRVVVR